MSKKPLKNRTRVPKFDRYHPAVSFTYFISMALLTMLTVNPILLSLSFLSAVLCTFSLIGVKKTLMSLAYSLPMMAIITVINPLFVHRGESILFFYNDQPITLEAIVYGAVMSVMIMAVFYWFKCYSIVVSEDKFIYLFGRVAPKLSLVLSMAMAFVPKMKRQYVKISNFQKTMGMYSKGGFADKILSRIRVVSALIGWALESSVVTADSMRARGYGLSGRTSYSLYKIRSGELVIFFTNLALVVMIIVGIVLTPSTYYYPKFSGLTFGFFDIYLLICFAFLGLFATIVELKERVLWRLLISKI